MPETTGPASPPVLPRLIVSKPSEDTDSAPVRPTLASRRRSKTESAAIEPGGRQAAIAWYDTDSSSPRKRKKPARRSTRRANETAGSHGRSGRSTESGVDRFFPKLSRILESSESRNASRPGSSGVDSRRHLDKSSVRRGRRKEDYPVGYHRVVRNRAGGVSRRAEPFKVNPSLLSVLSSLTRSTEQSSSSSATTITQRSYDRRKSDCETLTSDRHHSDTDAEAKKSSSPRSVVVYMDATTFEDDHEGQTTYSGASSSSSHYEPSDAGSSEISGTPSSQSTFPSPDVTRNSSFSSTVAELRRKYDTHHVASTTALVSPRRSSQSPETPARHLKRSTQMKATVEDDEESNAGTRLRAENRRDERNSPRLRSSRPTQRPDDALRHQEDALRRHLAYTHQGQHLIDPVYGQHRSPSTSSQGSNGSARAYAKYMAMQQYQYPQPPAPMAYPVPPQAMNGHMPQCERPPAPDAPDLNQRTLAGYEQLALELAKYESPVKPLYRKFEYLNHRILLHMQDELCEMEEQLRTVDEIIAQMEPLPAGGQHPPASRRGDAFNGTDMHHRRTALLGRIFMKTEQYNRAMSSFATLNKDSQPAEAAQVAAYREWLKKKSPIHELETRFLQRGEDLILPGNGGKPADQDTVYRPNTAHSGGGQAALLTCLPIALMLPLLLFSIIPNTIGRLVVTALIAIAAFMVAATTNTLRDRMALREWAVCGAAYVLLMGAIAGCVPTREVSLQHVR